MYKLTILVGLLALCIVNCAPRQRGSNENKDDRHASRSSPSFFDGSRPTRPTGDFKAEQNGSRPPKPTGTFLPLPEGSRAQRPTGDFKLEQDASRPPRPTGSFPSFPEGSRPPRPTGDASRPFGVSGIKNSEHPPKATDNGKSHSEPLKTNGDFKSSHPPKH